MGYSEMGKLQKNKSKVCNYTSILIVNNLMCLMPSLRKASIFFHSILLKYII